jgi:putative SOS response-associated peptidase YedK
MPKFTLFNARSEDADTKPAFRDSFKAKRCLIPADGFYEWSKGEDGEKDPWHIHLPNRQPFSFAGLWAYNQALDTTCCTILTAAAQEPMKQLHDRQPIILDPAAYDAWLDLTTSVADAKGLLKHDVDDGLQFYRVHRAVNSSTKDKKRNDNASMIEPLAA